MRKISHITLFTLLLLYACGCGVVRKNRINSRQQVSQRDTQDSKFLQVMVETVTGDSLIVLPMDSLKGGFEFSDLQPFAVDSVETGTGTLLVSVATNPAGKRTVSYRHVSKARVIKPTYQRTTSVVTANQETKGSHTEMTAIVRNKEVNKDFRSGNLFLISMAAFFLLVFIILFYNFFKNKLS